MIVAIILLILQGTLGAADTIIYHELKIGLPKKDFAVTELRLHAARDFAYTIVFISLAWFSWHGVLALIFTFILLFEIIITLWDFIEEDLTRRLPAGERIMHTLMAIIYGGFIAYLVPELWNWWQLPTEFIRTDHGIISLILSLFALGVFLSGVRDLYASFKLKRTILWNF